MKSIFVLLMTIALLVVSSCGSGGGDGKSEPQALRISAITDVNAKKLEEQYKLVGDWLSGKIGMPVKFVPVQDYSAAVAAISTGQTDMVWFGGVTAVQAENRTAEGVSFVVCRDIDIKFKTYFIANSLLKIAPVDDLASLTERAKDRSFTFGSISSTSGHVMPRHFFTEQSGKRPEDVFANVAYSGSHDATLAKVANGEVDYGALNFSVYETASEEMKKKAHVVYETPPYVDYCFVARNGIGQELIDKIRNAFISLSNEDEGDAAILESFGAGRFITARREDWEGIRKVLRAGVDVSG